MKMNETENKNVKQANRLISKKTNIVGFFLSNTECIKIIHVFITHSICVFLS